MSEWFSIKYIYVIFMLFVLLDALSQEQCIKEDSVQRVTSCIFLLGLGFENSGIILISQNLQTGARREMCLGQQQQRLGATMKRRLVITRAVMWEPRVVLSSWWWNMNTTSWYFLTGIVSWNNFANNNDANWCGNIDVCYYLWIGLLLLLRILRFIQGPFRTLVLG